MGDGPEGVARAVRDHGELHRLRASCAAFDSRRCGGRRTAENRRARGQQPTLDEDVTPGKRVLHLEDLELVTLAHVFLLFECALAGSL